MRHPTSSRPIVLATLILSLGAAACQQPAPAAATPPPVEPRASPPVPSSGAAHAAARLTGGDGRAARWKDTAVYLDGAPIGMLAFGELPIGLAPVWIEDEVSVPVKPGQRGPGYRRVTQRQYRFVDYLRALGVDPARVQELHIHGAKASEVLIVPGAQLRRRGSALRFRFGAEVAGKAIPVVPDGLGNGRSPDKISAVAVYAERTPPRLVRNVGLFLGDAPVPTIAYAGELIRGGVHVYLDDRLATVIKRNRLTAELPPAAPDARWRLLELLAAQGVDTRRVVELWIIRGERRQERISGPQLAAATVELGAAASAVIHVGGVAMPAGALALHSRALRPSELPQVRPDEDEASSLATP
jgi:hypothetical protein